MTDLEEYSHRSALMQFEDLWFSIQHNRTLPRASVMFASVLWQFARDELNDRDYRNIVDDLPILHPDCTDYAEGADAWMYMQGIPDGTTLQDYAARLLVGYALSISKFD